WKETQCELEELAKSEQEKLRLSDLWSFQLKEIDSVDLKAGEDVELENESRVLKNVARLQEQANAAYAALYDSPSSASAQVRTALKKLEELCRIDEKLEATLETLKAATIGIDEASDACRDYLDRLESDPDRLEDVESRLEKIDRLKR